MNNWFDNPWEGMIFETAITIEKPRTVEENIGRGKAALRKVMISHATELMAMYREDLGWIGFEWGDAGVEPPNFQTEEQFRAWQKSGRKPYDKGGHGIAHIIAKRDWEGQHIQEFLGQKGVDEAYRIVEAIARGREVHKSNIKAKITWQGLEVVLNKKQTAGMIYWLITGFTPGKHGYHYVPDSAVAIGGVDDPSNATHIWPTPDRPNMGAAQSDKIFERAVECVSVPDHTTHLRMNDLQGFVQTWERQAQPTDPVYQNQQVFCKCNSVDESEMMRRIWAGGYF